jgi:hypothetical protein
MAGGTWYAPKGLVPPYQPLPLVRIPARTSTYHPAGSPQPCPGGADMTTARVASDALTLALLNMAARGERSHCSDPTSHHLWLGDHEAERQVAVMLCDHCPVLTVCRDTAETRGERWGAWGRKDFSRGPGRTLT